MMDNISTSNKDIKSYLTFQLNSIDFLLKSSKVIEILDNITIFPIPTLFSHCEGLYLFREQLIPILNFQQILFQSMTQPLEALRHFSKIIIISFEDFIFGFQVERISKLITSIPNSSIPAEDLIFPNIQKQYIKSLLSFQKGSFLSINFSEIFRIIFNFP